jgi:hypothetical protein
VDEKQSQLAGVASRAVVLVEGISDQRAIEALAERRGRNLDDEGISVVPIGGAQSIGRFLCRFGPQGLDVRLAGLCDAGEEADFRRGLERAGLGSNLTRADMESLGFYVCVADLEDELIRALGARLRGTGRRRSGRPWILPHPPEAACVARTEHRGAASTLHGQRR